MTSKRKIRFVISFVSIMLLCVAVFVIADYFALFGTSQRVQLDFVEARFKTVEQGTGKPVIGAGVRCFQKGSENACTLRDSHKAGVVSVHVPFMRMIESSLLFTQNETIKKAADPKIHMFFIHNQYVNETVSLYVEDIFANPGKEYLVEMAAPTGSNAGSQDS